MYARNQRKKKREEEKTTIKTKLRRGTEQKLSVVTSSLQYRL
jgi:hypothetical protein